MQDIGHRLSVSTGVVVSVHSLLRSLQTLHTTGNSGRESIGYEGVEMVVVEVNLGHAILRLISRPRSAIIEPLVFGV